MGRQPAHLDAYMRGDDLRTQYIKQQMIILCFHLCSATDITNNKVRTTTRSATTETDYGL
jgi:hypothetical protein